MNNTSNKPRLVLSDDPSIGEYWRINGTKKMVVVHDMGGHVGAVGSLKEAKRLAADWDEMESNPDAVWAQVSLGATSEAAADEIIALLEGPRLSVSMGQFMMTRIPDGTIGIVRNSEGGRAICQYGIATYVIAAVLAERSADLNPDD